MNPTDRKPTETPSQRTDTGADPLAQLRLLIELHAANLRALRAVAK